MNAFAEFINEWPQIGPGYNWRTFHPVMLEFEDDRHLGAVEATVILLGIGVRVRWTYAHTEAMARIERSIAELEDLGTPTPRNGDNGNG